jgi:hypothetical protein
MDIYSNGPAEASKIRAQWAFTASHHVVPPGHLLPAL